MTNRCDTCTHWVEIALSVPLYDRPALRDEAGEELHDEDYEPVPAPGRWGWCGRAAEFGPTRSDRFYVVDGSTYMAKLGTRSDFGCVEHEPRPPVNQETS